MKFLGRCLPGLGIVMINEDFHIAGIWRFFKWKMLSLSGPNVLLFLQLLIALVTMSAVKVSAISIGFLLVSLVTNRVSLEDECLPSFEVLNCLLNLAASCLDDENEIPLKELRLGVGSWPSNRATEGSNPK